MIQKFLIIMMVFATATAQGQLEERKDIEKKYTWDLTPIFESDEAWTAAKAKIKKDIAKVSSFKGKLTSSPEELYKALEYVTELRKALYRVSTYAGMKSDEDTRVSKYAAMRQEASSLSTELSSISAYFVPELLKADPDKLKQFINSYKPLETYKQYIEDVLRKRPHNGTEEVEKVIALSGLMAGTPSNIFGMFYNADFPFPEIEVEGEKVKLSPSVFSVTRAKNDRELRQRAFEAFFTRIGEYQRTFGAQLYGSLQKDVFYSKARNYNNTLESALDAANIPTDVYHNLVKSVNDNLSTFHRYLNLRKRMLGVDTLHYYDLYAPLVGEVDLKYSVEEAQDIILKSLSPLGEDYVHVVDSAFRNRWIDMLPNVGKRTGAYSNGSAYDVHPYILMNYTESYNDVSTLTHELGHTMHSYLTNAQQAFINSNYSIFVAEVASTVNEAFLNDYLLDAIDNDTVRLAILGNFLEGAKGTLFRQTQFAEFELAIHEKVENGEAMTGEKFDDLYAAITRKYYGHDKGICIVDDYIKSEWSYIPHFYYNYYVYQYATSFTAAQAIVQNMYKGGEPERERYINFLSAGSSKYPVELLADAGVVMTGSEPFDLTMQKINKVMDEMEAILDKLDK